MLLYESRCELGLDCRQLLRAKFGACAIRRAKMGIPLRNRASHFSLSNSRETLSAHPTSSTTLATATAPPSLRSVCNSRTSPKWRPRRWISPLLRSKTRSRSAMVCRRRLHSQFAQAANSREIRIRTKWNRAIRRRPSCERIVKIRRRTGSCLIWSEKEK